jgi:hypothetical protein
MIRQLFHEFGVDHSPSSSAFVVIGINVFEILITARA